MFRELLVQLPNLLGFIGMVVAGNRKRSGWAIGFASEIAWASWAYVDHLPALYPWCIIWGVVYGRNWFKWNRETKDAVPSE